MAHTLKIYHATHFFFPGDCVKNITLFSFYDDRKSQKFLPHDYSLHFVIIFSFSHYPPPTRWFSFLVFAFFSSFLLFLSISLHYHPYHILQTKIFFFLSFSFFLGIFLSFFTEEKKQQQKGKNKYFYWRIFFLFGLWSFGIKMGWKRGGGLPQSTRKNIYVRLFFLFK